MIFDEVDRGVGGAVASAIGERLARLAAQAQVLVVTHSPQVAARATHHYRIEKSHDGRGHAHLGPQARRRRAARGNRADAVGRGDHRRSPRPGGAADGGSMTEQTIISKQEYQRPEPWSMSSFTMGPAGVLPTVIIIPTVMGVQPLEIGFAESWSGMAITPSSPTCSAAASAGVDKEAAFAAMGELRSDRAALRDGCFRPRRGWRAAEHVDREPDRRHRLLFRRAMRARRGAVGRGHRRRRQLPRPVRPARTAARADQGQGRGLPRLGRPDGAARSGRGAGQ